MSEQDATIEQLMESLAEQLYRGAQAEVLATVTTALARGTIAADIVNRGLMLGMQRVGVDFRDGKLFLPEVLMAAQAMQAAMRELEPLLIGPYGGGTRVARAVIGTVKGDIHDIGKNLVSILWRGAGFEVIDLGINTKADTFVEAVERHRPEIVGLSALLTTTMPYMRVVIDALRQRGLRERLIVLVGGAAVSRAFADEIGADGYGRDAASAVDLARTLLARRRGGSAAPEGVA